MVKHGCSMKQVQCHSALAVFYCWIAFDPMKNIHGHFSPLCQLPVRWCFPKSVRRTGQIWLLHPALQNHFWS
jgi:hypothetical protein